MHCLCPTTLLKNRCRLWTLYRSFLASPSDITPEHERSCSILYPTSFVNAVTMLSSGAPLTMVREDTVDSSADGRAVVSLLILLQFWSVP